MKERTVTKRATLRDIAQDVGVSTGTVSVVLNGARSGTSVADRTREAIHESARRLGYRPNWVAKTLQGGRTRTIGIIPTQAGQDFLLGPYLQRVLNAVANVLAAQHHDLLILTRCDQSDAEGILQGVVNGRIDGAIVVAPPFDSRLVETLDAAGFPFVVIDGVPGGHAACFDVDEAEGTRLGLEHLRSLGHRRIAYIAGPQNINSGRERLEAFLRNWGPDEPTIACGDYTIDSGTAAFRALLDRGERPTALLCANDEMAAGAMRAAREAGLVVPRDLSIVGFDDSPSSADLQPALTTYAQPVDRVAAAAAEAVLGCLDNLEPVRGKTFPGHLVIRESTDRPTPDNLQ